MVAAGLLLHLDEEAAYWMFCAVVENVLPADYFTPGMAGVRADQQARPEPHLTHRERETRAHAPVHADAHTHTHTCTHTHIHTYIHTHVHTYRGRATWCRDAKGAGAGGAQVLAALLAERLPALHAHLVAVGFDLSLATTSWFVTMYMDSCPLEVRVAVAFVVGPVVPRAYCMHTDCVSCVGPAFL
jgi:hypothetical protein